MKIGILGGGQLARMLVLSGYPLGMEFIVLDPSEIAGAVALSQHLHGDYSDPKLLSKLATQADVVTYEFENVPAKTAEFLSSHTQVYPSAKALAVAQDRLVEKSFFQDLNLQTAPFAAVNNLVELEQAMLTIGYPAILKSRRMGYDGKGQVLIKTSEQLASAWAAMQTQTAIVEAFVNFKREISIIAARSSTGEIVCYPVSENQHAQGILRVATCCPNDPMQAQAEKQVKTLVTALDYVGVIALELFEVAGKLLVNEFAPRVHNSGHWSIEGAQTSQFENHLRAITGLPLGDTSPRGYTAMVNFIGSIPKTADILAIPAAHLHLYAKSARAGRKVAHVNICADNQAEFQQTLKQVQALASACELK